MLQTRFLISTKIPSDEVSYFSVGFARLTDEDSIRDASSAGSGTLVRIGSLHGILTAGHVVDALPRNEKVGIILRASGPDQFQKQVINMAHTEDPIVIRGAEYGPDGPDLAFLRIPEEPLGWLKAKCSFYNLRKRRDDVLARKQPTPNWTDAIFGVIHELTHLVPEDSPGTRRIQFYCTYCGVRMSALKFPHEYHMTYFQMNTAHEPDFKGPNSFEGTSGGAVWRTYVRKNGDGVEIVEMRLIAVPFYQSASSDGKPQITCHGDIDIYGHLIDEVTARWPAEASAA